VKLKQYKHIVDVWERGLDQLSIFLNTRVVVDTITTRFLLLFLFLLSIPLMAVILFSGTMMNAQINLDTSQQMTLTRHLYTEGINRMMEANGLPSNVRPTYCLSQKNTLEIDTGNSRIISSADIKNKKTVPQKALLINDDFLNQLYQRFPILQTEVWVLDIPPSSPYSITHVLAHTNAKGSEKLPFNTLLEKLKEDMPQEEPVNITLQGIPYQIEESYLFNSEHQRIAKLVLVLPLRKQNKVIDDYYFGIYIIAVSSLLFSVLLAMMAGRTITQPLLKLIRQVETTSRESFLKNQGEFKVNGVEEIRQLAESFNRLVSRLKQEQLLRDEFVATLTHDLKVPMLAEKQTLAYFQKGTYGDINEEQVEVLDILRSSNLSCLSLVNGLLEVYRYDSGSVRLIPEPFDLLDLLNSVISELSTLAIEKRLNLNKEIEEFDHYTVYADKMEIKRVLQNLISNAITNTSRYGSITCRLSPAFSKGRQVITKVSEFQHSTLSHPIKTFDRILISIADTGVGFTQENLPRLFKQFGGNKGRDPMSIGLGLYNCHQVIHAHNSVLWVESSEGEGSSVNFLLPINDLTFQDRRIRHDRRK
jgi:signal transduction histidine kinase